MNLNQKTVRLSRLALFSALILLLNYTPPAGGIPRRAGVQPGAESPDQRQHPGRDRHPAGGQAQLPCDPDTRAAGQTKPEEEGIAMRILYECRGITLADTGEGYVILKRSQVYIDSIETPREAVILFTEILQTEMLRRVERYEQKKKAEL